MTQTTTTDSELLARVNVQDLDAFGELWARYRIESLLAVAGRDDGLERVLAVWRDLWHQPPALSSREMVRWLRIELARGSVERTGHEAETVPDRVGERRSEMRKLLERAVHDGRLARGVVAELCG